MDALPDFVAAHLPWAKQVITENPDRDADGYMSGLAKCLLAADPTNVRLPHAVAILAALRAEGWLESEPNGTRDRIAG